MIKVYGASDDLVEVEGDIEEEWGSCYDGGILACSDGTLIAIEYDGEWHLSVLHNGDSLTVVTPMDRDKDEYTDTVTIDGPIKWVVVAPKREDNMKSHAIRRKP